MLGLFASALVSCAPVIRLEQTERTSYVNLRRDQSVGQSFVARYDGLEGVAIYLKPGQSGDGDIVIILRNSTGAAKEIARSTIKLRDIDSPGYYKFSFPTLGSSSLSYYYLTLNTTGSGSVQVGNGPGDSYLSGSSYQDGEPQDGQLTFRLIYNPEKMILGLIGEGLRWIGYLLIAGFLILLPGWAFSSWLFPAWRPLNWVEKTGLAIGAGLAIYPLLFLWADVVGLRIGQVFAWAAPVLSLCTLAIQSRPSMTNLSNIRQRFGPRIAVWMRNPDRLADLAFLAASAMIAFSRFWAIRTLDAPMWGDSYHHTLIARLIVDHNGLFQSWAPYAELQSFTYHFGFHTQVAAFHWLTAMDISRATLLMGQIINIFAVISLYPLGSLVAGNRWSGVFAVLIAGLLSPLPMAYVNWGRYTQLTGQAILPAAIVLTWLNLKTGKISWKWLFLIWIVLSGLFLTHYRVILFVLLFYLAFLILFFRQWKDLGTVKLGLIHAIGALALVLPWLYRVYGGKLPFILGLQLSTPASQITAAAQESNAIGHITAYLPAYLWILLGLGVAYAIWTRKREIFLVTLWAFLVFLAANPSWFGLPGTGVFSNFAVLIAAYIPAGIITGASLTSFFSDKFRGRNSLYLRGAVLLLVSLSIGIWGVRSRLHDILPAQHALVTRPDIQASAWIRDHIPEDARFLVNSFFAYGGSLIVGSDAGWWLPIAADRDTTLPPINYGSETGPYLGYLRWVNALTEQIEAKGIDNPDVLRMLKEREVTNIYIGQQQGRVNDIDPLLSPEEILSSPFFSPIYHKDRVWIFEVTR
jgi:hypothetical protein